MSKTVGLHHGLGGSFLGWGRLIGGFGNGVHSCGYGIPASFRDHTGTRLLLKAFAGELV